MNLYHYSVRLTGKRGRILVLISIVCLVVVLVFMLRKRYNLNRAVRNVGLRLVQYERLSLIRKVDYKFIFHENRYGVYSYDSTAAEWTKFEEHKYSGGITCQADGYEFVFSRGRFKEYHLGENEGGVPKYVILYFYHPQHLSMRKGIIFYMNDDWKILG